MLYDEFLELLYIRKFRLSGAQLWRLIIIFITTYPILMIYKHPNCGIPSQLTEKITENVVRGWSYIDIWYRKTATMEVRKWSRFFSLKNAKRMRATTSGNAIRVSFTRLFQRNFSVPRKEKNEQSADHIKYTKDRHVIYWSYLILISLVFCSIVVVSQNHENQISKKLLLSPLFRFLSLLVTNR